MIVNLKLLDLDEYVLLSICCINVVAGLVLLQVNGIEFRSKTRNLIRNNR